MLEYKSVSAAEVKRIILSDLVTSKAPGPDGILPSELKLVAGEIVPTIAILFNESLATGLLPEQFRMANLVPVFKPGKTDTSSAKHYRGISLTCILSKVLEKIVFNQLNDYFTQCEALSDNQYGFRRRRSCADLLLTTLDDWYFIFGSRCQEIHGNGPYSPKGVVYVRSTFSSSLRRPLILALAYPSTYFSHLHTMCTLEALDILPLKTSLCSVSDLIFSQLHVSSRCEFLET